MRSTTVLPGRPLVLPSQAETEAIAKKLLGKLTTKRALVVVRHRISASAQYTGNEIRAVTGGTTTTIQVTVDFSGRIGAGSTNRIDEEGLSEFVANLEAATKEKRDAGEPMELMPPATFTDPSIYFQSTLDAGDPEWQGDLMRGIAKKVVRASMVGSGEVSVSVSAKLVTNTEGLSGYTRETSADLSMTARTPGGKGSGWCWDGGYDMAPVNPDRLIDYAIDIARRSESPQSVEPGRYTVIMEPDAVQSLVAPISGDETAYMQAEQADLGFTVFSKRGGGSKIGLKMADRRVRFESNPFDPLVPYSPLGNDGAINQRIDWINSGILRNLWYPRIYARETNNAPNYPPTNPRLEVDIPPKSLAEMIAETERGLWIHRFGGVGMYSTRTLLLSGVTRDGTFLIENGKIAKPVQNLRFAESPFFMLNKIEAAGIPERTSRRFALPRIKVRDFEFISLSDAV